MSAVCDIERVNMNPRIAGSRLGLSSTMSSVPAVVDQGNVAAVS